MKSGVLGVLLGATIAISATTAAKAIPAGALESSGQYPYVGAVFYGSGVGSGVLIAPDVVLTAGHVVEDVISSGTQLFLTGVDPFSGADTTTGISGSVLHPSYSPSVFGEFDIGLLFLSSGVVLPEYATLAPDSALSLLSEPVDVVGYGGDFKRRVGAEVIDPVFTTTEVINVFSPVPIVEPGDSGGGLFIDRSGDDLLAGTTSFSSVVCGGPNPCFAGFASVSAYRGFIDQHAPQAVWYGQSQAMPEPSGLATFGASLAALGWMRRRRRPGHSYDA